MPLQGGRGKCQSLTNYRNARMSNPIDRAYAAYGAGDLQSAKSLVKRILVSKPAHVPALFLSATLEQTANHAEAALALFNRIIALDGKHAGAHYSKGLLLSTLKRHAEAMPSHDAAVRLEPRNAWAWVNRGNSLAALKEYDNAIADFDAALAINPKLPQAYANKASALSELKKYEAALVCCDKALELDQHFAEAWSVRGLALLRLGRIHDALASMDRAISLKPELADAWLNRGAALREVRQYDDALLSLDKALLLKPENAQAWFNRGGIFSLCKRHEDAIACYEQALRLNQNVNGLYGSWLHAKMYLCDWDGIEEAFERVASDTGNGVNLADPFAMLATPTHPKMLRECAERYTADTFPAADQPAVDQHMSGGKIRIGYFSADFHNHPGMSLMAELFEIHDRSRFEIYAFSFSVEPEDDARRRVAAGVDHYLDVKDLSDQEIVAKSRELGIDIAINRNGYTMDGRAGIFAHRAAPVQVNFLGYPGTLGADYIDYIVADPVLIPESYREYYTEKIAYLPHTYQPNDRKREISDRVFTRSELGLPEDGFVFCCFNNDYKLTPDVFDIWMRLLQQVPKSVLWLLGGNEFSARNLWREADRRGIAADRLVFAGRVNKEEHLSRHRQADLFVDTFYYNAHTTASDALWAGLPVVTCLGEAFASRVAASLLGAMGLPELVTDTREQYEALIVELATQPDKLAAIKDRLAQNRLAQPLFQTDLYARHLEKAFEMMVERQRQGLPPDHLVVPA